MVIWRYKFSIPSHTSNGLFSLLTINTTFFVYLFDFILYIPANTFQLFQDRSSWVEPILSSSIMTLAQGHNAVPPMRQFSFISFKTLLRYHIHVLASYHIVQIQSYTFSSFYQHVDCLKSITLKLKAINLNLLYF